MRRAQGQRRHLARVRCRTVAPALSSTPAGTHPHSRPCSQLVRQPALRPRLPGHRHLHHRGHHQAVRGAQGHRRHLARVCRRTVAPALYASIITGAPFPTLYVPPVYDAPACTHSLRYNDLRQDDRAAIQQAFQGPPANLQLFDSSRVRTAWCNRSASGECPGHGSAFDRVCSVFGWVVASGLVVA